MAAWYNGETQRIYDITKYGMNTQDMLSDFWFDLLNQNKGRSIYFHNWCGYDSILSLKPLVNLQDFSFVPVINNNEVISVKVKLNNKAHCSIIDSIKLLPSALAKLAKDWKVRLKRIISLTTFY